MHTCFRGSKALRASSGRDTHSDFVLAPSPERSPFSSCAICREALYELPIVAYKAKQKAQISI